MKLFFVTSYQYPSHPAPFRHGLIMAQNYSKILNKNFLYSVLFIDKVKELEGINFIEVNRFRLPLRTFRFISLFYFFWLGWFFMLNKEWRSREVVVITQESKIAFLLLFWKKIFKFFMIYECHGLHSPLTDKLVCRRADYLIFVNKATQQEAKSKFGENRQSIVLPNAVDHILFEKARQRKKQLRKELGLPINKILIGYIGRFTALGFDKGINNSLSVLKEIKNENILMCFVGGVRKELNYFRKIADELGVSSRAIFVPYQRETTKVAEYMVAMDVLIYLPPPEKFFLHETSPMKLFEYMAAEKPIVISDFPSMREILDEDSAVFVNPLNFKEVAEKIENLVADKQTVERLTQKAYQKVINNTWEKRAQTIIDLSKQLTLLKSS